MYALLNLILMPAYAADDPLVSAVRLPVVAHHLREDGVPDGDVKAALKASKDKNLPAGEARDALGAAHAAAKEHGPVDNFGAFVQAQLDAGKRGSELAAAIRAEHEAHGKGKGFGKHEPGQGPDGEHGKGGDDHGKDGKDHGKDGDDHGKDGDDHGKDGGDHGKDGDDHGKDKAERGKEPLKDGPAPKKNEDKPKGKNP